MESALRERLLAGESSWPEEARGRRKLVAGGRRLVRMLAIRMRLKNFSSVSLKANRLWKRRVGRSLIRC
ncbi:hypothetical protein I7I53_03453 [Histoplasma capsulatum var. duboisii H88]|uniref:Uncharacterized protein n=1 Tax=Ajellomyces capsulatus (strain H88) TaxID=544711 RepID=A0A8A1LT01_AJEC8|nr:hypothetical protein I7I53_03453 [Histoplasma capsulatum var. duboisii H88]